MKIVFVEGNIGSGKTSCLDMLEKKGFTVLREPVSDWQDVNGHNLLDLMYKDCPKYGFAFQTYAFISRMKLVLEEIELLDTNIIICERSVYTDRFVFFKTLVESGKVTLAESSIYNKLWDFWIDQMSEKIKNLEIEFLYIKCSPDLCMEHLLKRNRKEEVSVNKDYLASLDAAHDLIYNESLFAFGQERLVRTIENDGSQNFFNLIESLIYRKSWENKLMQSWSSPFI